ncbi:hypothetical protein [Bremerella cremea]|uniref:hypothetical protein n=1 Tax=Bremerella cremea TaxID=1031537 RepID=UPI0011C03D37|nr:hypothetical protein [Bremerella cremea]
MAWTPKSNRVQMLFELQPPNATAIDFIWFVHNLHQELKRKLIVVWDQLSAHRKTARVLEKLGANIKDVY